MKQLLTPEELLQNSEFELIEEVEYSNLKSFISEEVCRKSIIIRLYGFIQMLALLALFFIFAFFITMFIKNGSHKKELLFMGLSVLFSFTLLVPIHELLHAAAFLLLGKRDIGFGVQWKKFLFYAEANRQVLNREEMLFVALAPFITVFIAGMGCFFFSSSNIISISGLVIALLHFMFCGGDFAIISLFSRFRSYEMYTFDDRELKKSYYFKRVR
ncbi:MAG TPA: DUF3267 domain-containing protein [Prolixibacteraceae bacterium]|nr:DUF3267 domain-containing protein [Prolixibacteraceae bacterium]HPS11684.1 DUF3267 domain-containing protein [Prolixibacteraceae bacterium]